MDAPRWGDCSLHDQQDRGYDLGSTREESSYQLHAAVPPRDDEKDGGVSEVVPTSLVPESQPDAAKVSRPVFRKTWTAEVYDKATFIAWALNSGNLDLVEVNQVRLNGRARLEREALSIPGVGAVHAYRNAKK